MWIAKVSCNSLMLMPKSIEVKVDIIKYIYYLPRTEFKNIEQQQVTHFELLSVLILQR